MSGDPFSARKAGLQPRARDTVNAILEAAARLVYDEGGAQITTNRIAEVAGVSIGSLYQYFPGKDAILHSLVKREFDRTVDGNVRHIDSLDTSRLSLEDAIASIVDHVFDGQANRRPLYRQLAMSVLSIRHLSFTLENDARVLAAVRSKLRDYDGVDPATLDDALFVALYVLKGVQIGVVLSQRAADMALRQATTRAIVACLGSTGSRPGTC